MEERNIIGRFGLGCRNDRGDRLIQFCAEQNLAVMNTFFKLPKRRLYTWKSPADSLSNIIRNQIDYIMINQRFKNIIQSAKTYPGADIMSDHNVLVANIRVRFKKCRHVAIKNKLNMERLTEIEVKNKLAAKIEYDLTVKETRNIEETVEQKWLHMKNTISSAAREVLGTKESIKRRPWMNDHILILMEERRKYKNKNQVQYREIHKKIKRMIREAKEDWFAKECLEIEQYQEKYDTFNMHKKIKYLAGTARKNNPTKLYDNNGDIIVEIEQKLIKWKEFVEDLFHDDRPNEYDVLLEYHETGPSITFDEVNNAISRSKTRKATGPDEIFADFIKILSPKCIQKLTELFNNIYTTGQYPEDWLKSTFVTIPKKQHPKQCSDYRTISLMSHVLKIYLKVIHARIYNKLESQLSDSQFGFRNGLGTREALFFIQVLVQRCRDVNRPVFLCFIDFEKAFDKVQHNKLIEILRTFHLDKNDVQAILKLYWNQKANVRVDGVTTADIEIKRGVRQGCILSPQLFNVYAENIFREALDDTEEGIKVNGYTLNNSRYADDTLLIADTPQDLETLLKKVSDKCHDHGLKLNETKTKYMVISKTPTNNTSIQLNGILIERVDKITYLGCQLNENWDLSKEIIIRIEKARSIFTKMRNVLCSHDLSLDLKIRILRCYVFSTLLYGVEAWTLTEASIKKLQAFEMWCYRRMLKISWTEHVTNDEVLRRMKKCQEIINTVKERKLQYFGHVVRHPEKYKLLKIVLEGKIEGKRGPGRRRISWLKNLRQWFNQSTKSLFRAAVDKVRIAIMLANVRNG